MLAPSGFASRWTFYIGADGRILDIDKKVSAASHGRDVVAKLTRISQADRAQRRRSGWSVYGTARSIPHPIPVTRTPTPPSAWPFVQEIPLDERELLHRGRARGRRSARPARGGREADGSGRARRASRRTTPTSTCGRRRSSMLRDIALEAFEGLGEAESLAAVDALDDPKTLVGIAKNASREATAQRALARVTDGHALGSIARHAEHESVRRAAFDRLQRSRRDAQRRAQQRIQGSDARGGRTDHRPRRARADCRAREEQERVEARARRSSARWTSALAAEEQAARDAAAAAALPRGRRAGLRRDRRAAQDAAPTLSRPAKTPNAPKPSGGARGARRGGAPARSVRAHREAAGRAGAGRARDRDAPSGKACRRSTTGGARRADAPLERAARACQKRHAEWRDVERRRARLRELADEAVRAARARGSAGGARAVRGDPPRVARPRRRADQRSGGRRALRRGADARSPRATPRRTKQDQKARREALIARCSSWSAASSRSPTRADLTLKAGERALKDIRTALGTMPQLPSKKDYDEIVRRLKAAQTALMPKVQELRDVADWQRWANVGIQEQLCEKMEALKAVEDPEEIAKQVRDLQQQWRQAADVPRAQGEALWQRFKTAHDEAWTRCEAHFAAQAEARGGEPREEDRAVRARRGARRLDQLDSDRRRDQEAAGRVEDDRRGQPRPGESRSGSASAAACDRFFTRRHADLAERKTVWAENLAKKEALCAKVEALRGLDRLGRGRGRDQAAAGRVEDDRPGEEEPLGSAVAAVPRRRAIISSPATRSATTSRAANGSPRARRSVAELEALAASSRQSPVVSRQSRSRRSTVAVESAVDGRSVGAVDSPQSAIRRSAIRNPQSAIGAAGRSDGDGASVARPMAGRDRRARRRSRSRGGARRALRRRRSPRVIARWPSVFGGTDLDPDANRKQDGNDRRSGSRTLAKSLGGPASAAARRGAVADHAAGGDAEGSARRQHDRRQGRRRQPVPRGGRRSAAGAGGAGRGSARCPIRCGGALADRFQRATRRIVRRRGRGRGRAGVGERTVDLGRYWILISSMSKTSMPYGALLALVGELLGNPEAGLLAFEHQLQAFGPAGDHAVEREGRRLAAHDRAVEHLAVGRPAGVVHRHLAVRLADAVRRCPASAPCRRGRSPSSSRRPAAPSRRPARASGCRAARCRTRACPSARARPCRRAPPESRAGASRRAPSAAALR